MKFEILNRHSAAILFSAEVGSLRLCVEAAIVAKADLQSADLQSANLQYANLQYANLRYANLRYADLQSADLQSANLQYANLQYADLQSADLQSANLRYADLQSANLQSANLQSANLRYAKGINHHRSTSLRMLLDQPGKIRAYKLVNSDGVGPFNGGIKYEIGGTHEVADANTDEGEQCGAGISVADLPWCMNEWREGYRILIAEFEAKDIACIPLCTDGKFRLHRCEIVGEKDLVEIGLIEAATATA